MKKQIESTITVPMMNTFAKRNVTLDQISKDKVRMNVKLINGTELKDVAFWAFQWKQFFGLQYEFVKDVVFTRVYVHEIQSIQIMRIPKQKLLAKISKEVQS